jgi:hypothetical protein
MLTTIQIDRCRDGRASLTSLFAPSLFAASWLLAFASVGLGQPACAVRLPDPKPVADWTFFASTYTHDGEGRRVDQHSQGVEPVIYERPDYQRSGFRHTRSTVQAGTSVDTFHVVDRWGPAVQPYGEWRYPYRPFAVPYGAWGPPTPYVNAQQSNFWPGGAWYPGAAHPGHPGDGPAASAAAMGAMEGMGEGAGGGGGFPGGGFPGGGFPGGGFPGGGFPGGYGLPYYPPAWSNGFGVGPNNVLRPEQDDYYPPAPEPPPVSDRDFFFVPRQK